jgi:hypothetical protein
MNRSSGFDAIPPGSRLGQYNAPSSNKVGSGAKVVKKAIARFEAGASAEQMAGTAPKPAQFKWRKWLRRIVLGY